MYVPPIVVYIVLAGFTLGLGLPIAVAAIGQRKRPGAIAGINMGLPLSIPAGLLGGMLLWSYLEEGSSLSREAVIIVGPLFGCFVGTLSVALLIREVGAAIGRRLSRRTERPPS